MSGLNLEKDTVLSSWTSGRPPDSVMDFRLTFGEGQARLFEKVTSYLRQGRCRSGHRKRRSCLCGIFRCVISLVRFRRDSRLTLKKSRVIGLCRSGHQRISMLRITLVHFEVKGEPRKSHTVLFMLDFWKTARFRHGFPTDF